MSWDVILSSPSKAMGTKEQVRESFLSACEHITGNAIPRRGPTEVNIDESFYYEVHFDGHKRAINSMTLAFKILSGDPHSDSDHPVRSFLHQISEQTGWEAIDTTTGATIRHE